MRALPGIILCVTMVVVLSACSTTGASQSSVSMNGWAGMSTDLRDPRLYMDDDLQFGPALSNPEYKYLLSNPNYH